MFDLIIGTREFDKELEICSKKETRKICDYALLCGREMPNNFQYWPNKEGGVAPMMSHQWAHICVGVLQVCVFHKQYMEALNQGAHVSLSSQAN
jgi:hypothetical protein